jgi:hypothetical protein
MAKVVQMAEDIHDLAEGMQEVMLQGLPRISDDHRISLKQRQKIAALRSCCMCWIATIVTGVLVLPLVLDIDLDDSTKAAAELIIVRDLCTANVPNINSTGWEEQLKGKSDEHPRHRRVFFTAKYDAGSPQLTLPKLQFLDSEGWRFPIPDMHKLLSFGLLKYEPLEQSVQFTNTAGCASVQNADLVDRFGRVAVQALRKAERPEVRIAPSTGLALQRSHNGILLREDTDTMMMPNPDLALAIFHDKFKHGNAWEWLQALNITLIVLLTINNLVVGGRMVYEDWLEGVQEWVLQYDYLWKLRDLREKVVKKEEKKKEVEEAVKGIPKEKPAADRISDGTSDDLQAAGSKEQPETAFTSYIQACTPFFILDHIVGNVVRNSEKTKSAISSAALQGLILASAPLLPVVAGFFYEDVRIGSFVVLFANYVFLLAFGPCYYFGVAFYKRRVPLFFLMVSLSVCCIASVTYLVAVILFLAQMVMADAAAVIGVILALGSLFIYPMIMLSRLKQIRSTYKHLKDKDDASRGQVAKGWEELHLTTRWIYVAIVLGTIELALLAILLLFAANIFAGETGFDNIIPTVTVPCLTFIKGYKQVQAKEVQMNIETKAKVDKVALPVDKVL